MLRFERLGSRRMLNADVSHPDPAEGEEAPTLDPAVAPTAEAASDPAQCLAVEGETLVTTQDVLLVANSPQEPRAPSAAEATTDVADDSAATTEDNVTTEDGDGITDHSNQSARTFASAVPDVEVADGTTPPTEAELADARSSEAPLAQPAEPAGEGDSPQTEQPGVGTAEVAGGEALQAAAIADGDGPSAERLDVNEDGLVTPQDALLIANYLCDPELLALDAAALDVNGDGEITAGDFDAVVDRLGHGHPVPNSQHWLPQRAARSEEVCASREWPVAASNRRLQSCTSNGARTLAGR